MDAAHHPAASERGRLRTTFDEAAARYERARPTYPPDIFDALVHLTGIRPGDRLLEVGPATGKATAALAERGFQITGVELGAELTKAAAERFTNSPEVTIVQDDFERWSPPTGVEFDLVLAATAWHWIDPVIRYRKAATALRPGGHLAVWSATHVLPEDDGDPFFYEIQDVYEEIGEHKPQGWRFPRPGELSGLDLEQDSNGLFEQVATRQFTWETTYDAEGYIELLDTFSNHMAMHSWQRQQLFQEIRRRIRDRPDGLLRRHWGAVLEVAQLRTT